MSLSEKFPVTGPAPDIVPRFDSPPLSELRAPRCPPYVEITNSDQLLPYLEHVARRP